MTRSFFNMHESARGIFQIEIVSTTVRTFVLTFDPNNLSLRNIEFQSSSRTSLVHRCRLKPLKLKVLRFCGFLLRICVFQAN